MPLSGVRANGLTWLTAAAVRELMDSRTAVRPMSRRCRGQRPCVGAVAVIDGRRAVPQRTRPCVTMVLMPSVILVLAALSYGVLIPANRAFPVGVPPIIVARGFCRSGELAMGYANRCSACRAPGSRCAACHRQRWTPAPAPLPPTLRHGRERVRLHAMAALRAGKLR